VFSNNYDDDDDDDAIWPVPNKKMA